MQENGALGLIATNSIAQGDSREVGLDVMVASGFTITRAIQSRAWPSTSANLEFAAVWGSLGEVSDDAVRVADDTKVRRISTLLEPAGRVEGLPVQLAENKGIAFEGCKLAARGFIVSEADVQDWLSHSAENDKVLFPYLNGEDLNSRPDSSASRWVIDFNDRALAESSRYQAPFARIAETVRAERARNNRKVYRDLWWQYAERRPALRKAIAKLSEVLVIARVSKTVMPMRVPVGQVFSDATEVFATDDFGDQAVLSSSLHQLWAITYGSGMRNDPRYTPSDVFETFPRPTTTAALESIGRVLDQERREIMLRRELGLTKLYNLVNDGNVQGDMDVRLVREIHVEIDRATMAAYGWEDVDLGHGFHEVRQTVRWSPSSVARLETLDRLLLENHQRAANQLVPNVQYAHKTVMEESGTLFD